MPEPLTTPRQFTKLPTYNTGAWRTAVVYSEALVASAEKAGVTEAVVQEFDSLIDDVLEKMPKLEAVLTSGFVDEEVKEAMLKKAFAKQASPVFLSFLQVVARHGRLDMLRLIHMAVHEEYNRVKNRVRVLVSTAEPLDAATEQVIAQEIQKRLHLQPLLDKQVHPELIGGMVLRVGDRVFDGSIATQLQRLRESMLTRSIHEIQSRRDRFSSAN
ncbi:MAG TPA: ATP synthase F1 subunit delta [Pirellulales bacterium]|jgi:F-type H+-transporting ATPase subunit delta|nr:ATP synthase F1 subunit delta [Pirellulales bacterium]